jgi:hypothetical protein
MLTSDRFVRFAAECESMAKFTHSRENRMAWNRIAERWMRCAELIDKQDSEAHMRRKTAKSGRRSPYS